MKKKNVQTIKHVLGVLIAEGAGNEIVDHCVRELAAMIEKDSIREYVRLLAKETARELRPKLEAVSDAVNRVPPLSVPSDKSELSELSVKRNLAEELRPFLAGREANDEREIISAIFAKFHCRNVDLAAIFGVHPNAIAKVKSGRFRSPTLSTAIRKFMEN